MDSFQKYSRLLLLLAGGFIALIAGLILLLFLLRLFSSTLIHVPLFDRFYAYAILLFPHLIFYTAYYYLYKNARSSTSRSSKILASVFLVMSVIICTGGLLLSTLVFAGIQSESLKIFEENSGYGFALQLALVLIITIIIAGGEKKEKDWMQRHTDTQ
jgi:hypothetical protein